ncbi:hypothetical protein V8E54_002242 [Elaphomyces granulatus]
MTRVLPSFTNTDWNQLGQIRTILAESPEGKFRDFDADIANAAKGAMKNTTSSIRLWMILVIFLYITMLLDPRFKKLVLEHELKDGAENIVAAMQQQLENKYPSSLEPEPPATSEELGPSTIQIRL